MTQTELRRNDEDVVVLLRVAELLEHLLRLRELPQIPRTEFASAPVLELPSVQLEREQLALCQRSGWGRLGPRP
jgi:hypothetical protein